MLSSENLLNSDELSDGVQDLYIVMSQINIDDVKYSINDSKSNKSFVPERKRPASKNENFFNIGLLS